MIAVQILIGKHKNKVAKVEKASVNSTQIMCEVPLPKQGHCYLSFYAENLQQVDPILYHTDSDRWNPKHFGDTPRKIEESGQLSIFFDDSHEPPDPDDYSTIDAYLNAWELWEQQQH